MYKTKITYKKSDNSFGLPKHWEKSVVFATLKPVTSKEEAVELADHREFLYGSRVQLEDLVSFEEL